MMSPAISLPCRSCGHRSLLPVLDLGETPLANSLLSADQLGGPEPVFPLALAYCSRCTLVQITESVPPDQMFRDYAYFSSYSDTMLRHACDIAQQLSQQRKLNASSLVVEIASNDGYLLQYYKQRDIPVLGIEPALNIARVAEQERGIPTVSEFFGVELARRLREQGHAADVIHANNVLAHVPDLNGFVAGIGILLKPGGIASIEFPYVKELIDRVEFDTIYHEHLCYFSLTAVEELARRQGLLVAGVEGLPIHGGSLRVYLAHPPQADPAQMEWRKPADMLAEEKDWGVGTFEFYEGFAQRVQRLRDDLRELLQRLKQQGHSIAAYGAAAKGSTLLNYCGLGREVLDFVADRSPIKQGRFMPGVRLPILPPEMLLEAAPDYVLMLAWNLEREILSQQAEYRRRGGKFIVPVPDVRTV